MWTQVFKLNNCINSYAILGTMADQAVRFMYRQLIEEYNVNKQYIYRMSLVKYEYFMYLDSIYIPHIAYMRQLLLDRKVEIDSIEKELGIKIDG